MAYTGKPSDLITGEQMGVFSGYIRRPLPNQAGMIAQIFGENGDDADTILALSLSKYQDVQVFVNIYIIKDPDGKIMKQGEEYPVISSFLGFVRRSLPKKDGMIAQFFSPNGEHADSVALLSKSEYQDCLVFVDVRGSLASKEPEKVKQENITEIDTHYSEKITKHQKIDLNRKDKSFKKMNEQIRLSEFLYRIEVVSALGDTQDYQKWLKNRLCVHSQERQCKNPVNVIAVDGFFKPYHYLPCCDVHAPELSNVEHLEQNRIYYEMKHRLLIKEWVWEKMQEQFSLDGGEEPDPAKVIDWAASHNVSKYLPHKYLPVV